ncbi:hypothetical protein ACQFYA_06835 [Promicromonospora sp. Marseille-Q5078]
MTTFITFAVCAAIVGMGLWTLVKIRNAHRLARLRIEGVRAVVADVPHPATSDYRTLMLRRAQDGNVEVAHLWHEYNETLVNGRDGALLNTWTPTTTSGPTPSRRSFCTIGSSATARRS